MLMTFEPSITLGLALVALVVMALGIAYFAGIRTPAPRGGKSSTTPSDEAMWSPKKPSIEVSEKSFTASITVPANPHRPVVYTVEPLNGSERLVKLTVLYEQSPEGSELAILKSADFDSPPPQMTVHDPDDPAWIAKIRQMQGGDPR